MKNKIEYFWNRESLKNYFDGFGTNDIVDHDFSDTLKNCATHEEKISLSVNDTRLVLVRHEWNEFEGIVNEQVAYAWRNCLPEYFDGGSKVPARFHNEFKNWINRNSANN